MNGGSDRVHAELMETQYRQARNNIIIENACLVFMVATALLRTDWRIVAAWAAVEVGTQVYRQFRMLHRYAAGIPAVNFAAYWSRHHAIYQTTLGVVWGATMFLFAHPADPISVATTACVIILLTAGAVPGQSYNPPALFGYLFTTYVPMVIRLLTFSGTDYHLFGVLLAAFAGALVLMCRLQAESFAAGVRIRYENVELVDALRAQTEVAVAARAAAETASLAKSQFLAAASHDLRQPLYALGLFSATLQSLDLKPDAREIVGHVKTNLDALEGLFSGLLDISRLEAGVITIKPETIATDTLFDRLDHYLRPIATEHGLDLRYRSDGSAVRSDPALLEQILLNLGSNALRNTLHGGVLIAARRRGGAVRFEVWDTGIGIAAADIGRIFDDFIQVGNPERNRRKGMGLGLAIAARSARLLDAQIEMRSQPGRGSVFQLTQPLADGAVARQDELAADTGDPIAGLRVLIIDDDPEVRDAIAVLLRQWGIEVEVVADAATARALIRSGACYDVILTDYRLPGTVSGLDLVAQLEDCAGRSLNCCIVTGDLDPGVIAAAAARGVPLMHKPLQPARLRALIAHLATKSFDERESAVRLS
ncbi:ATP-binding response regulator [Glacieibacterium megasporae]|uniref:ATP-binding response regulator n=1 Tax=Glacieibacterium megasporae TaxID=2835787 RepID=UPI001C1E3F7A|nr:hybrid sensor histidine kinase/response regulator [Polymorphobacter megasporae]UAJ09820.1 hybrid sensor histidine kinase/response regulator [Polymorphobacter megasporae]